MKKYLLLFLIAIFVMSCSKKVEVKGKIAGANPDQRIEFVEASGVATLPIANFGIDKFGNFEGTFEAPKDGMYVINYEGRQNLIFLRGGQKVNISALAGNFPEEYTITGDAKNDNDFFKACQKFLGTYGQSINVQKLTSDNEKGFLAAVKKIEEDVNKNIEENEKKYNPGSAVVNWKKDDAKAAILNLMVNYEMSKVNPSNPSFKLSKEFTDYEVKLQGDKDRMLKTSPFYRQYLLTKISPSFQKFAEGKQKTTPDLTASEMFNLFLKSKSDIDQTTKDYLLAFVMAQSDMHPDTETKVTDKIKKIIEEDIKDANIKKDLKRLQFVVTGFKIGDDAPEVPLITADGKAYKLSENKGKPYLLSFYASWNPYIRESTIPVLNEVINFYKSKMNFVFVNIDDKKEQFTQMSSNVLKPIQAAKVYAEGGLTSEAANKYGIYAFKLPAFILVDKNGKIASRTFYNLGDQGLIEALDKVTGLSAPKVEEEMPIQQPMPEVQEAPAQK